MSTAAEQVKAVQQILDIWESGDKMFGGGSQLSVPFILNTLREVMGEVAPELANSKADLNRLRPHTLVRDDSGEHYYKESSGMWVDLVDNLWWDCGRLVTPVTVLYSAP